ncbi:MAG TPA: hypothetical protein VD833_15835 [Vicinamibacterales bacterium]|nr:hypothetical protein [Vicinamibacterales bacterium]
MSGERAGRPVTVGDVVIEPIERLVVSVENIGGAIVGIALKEPVAVIIRTPGGAWRVDLETSIPPG